MKKLFTLLFLCLVVAVFNNNVYASGWVSNTNHPESFCSSGKSVAENLLYNESLRNKLEFFQDSTTDKNDLAVFTGMGRPRPGFTHSGGILVENLNFNDAIGISLTVIYDTSAVLLTSNCSFTLSMPGTAVFYFDTVYAKEKKFLTLDFYTPPDITLLGHQLWISASLTLPAFDLNLANNYDNTACKITGSFDPNTKSVSPEGFDLPNYIPVNQEELKYTINFQNTGTDTAFNITVVDTISSYLDPYSVQPGASSHPYSWEILAPDVFKIHFININLPDSNTNESRSHGFISFTINTRPNLLVGDNIKNGAYIFFDFNPGVSTNTTANELFDCGNISSFTLFQSNICSGDLLTITQNSIVPHTSAWYVDSVWMASGDSFVFSSTNKGLQQVILIAETPYCKQTISSPINVIVPAKPVIVQNGFLLSASPGLSYQWFSNGIAIPGAQNISFLAPFPGYYLVLVSDIFGCMALSDSVYVTNVGFPDLQENDVIISPNPFHDDLLLQSTGPELISVQLINKDGKILKSGTISNQFQKINFNTSDISSGIYLLRIMNNKFVMNKTIVKIK